MRKLIAKIKEELLAVLPPTLFFFVALHIVAFVRVLMLKGTGIPISSSVSVTIGALILGKAVLIADMLPVINRYPDKPLIYNVAWKTLIYILVAALIHYLERLFDFSRQAGGVVAGNERLIAEIVWPHVLAIQIILCVLILMYCTMHDARARARHRQRKGSANILRTIAGSGGLSTPGIRVRVCAHRHRTMPRSRRICFVLVMICLACGLDGILTCPQRVEAAGLPIG